MWGFIMSNDYVMSKNAKMALKIIIIITLSILLITAFVLSWVEAYWYAFDVAYEVTSDAVLGSNGAFLVVLNEETASKIDSGEMTIEDFGYKNFHSISKNIAKKNCYCIYLKKSGVRRVKAGIVHCSKLDFVEDILFWGTMFFGRMSCRRNSE